MGLRMDDAENPVGKRDVFADGVHISEYISITADVSLYLFCFTKET